MKYFILFITLLTSINLYAKNTGSSGTLKIKNINFYSKQESIYPEHKGLLQVSFESPITWVNGGTCGTTSVVIRNEDNHLVSAILAARLSAKSIRIYADDRKQLKGQCYLRAIGL